MQVRAGEGAGLLPQNGEEKEDKGGGSKEHEGEDKEGGEEGISK